MKSDLRFERTYPHAPEKVFRALANREALAAWLMPNDFEPRVGHKFNFRTDPVPGAGFDGIVHCEVLECDPPHRLAYSWRGGNISTVVRWTLTPVAGGTQLVMQHEGFEGPEGAFVSQLLGKGWNKMLDQSLPAVIAGERAPAACH